MTYRIATLAAATLLTGTAMAGETATYTVLGPGIAFDITPDGSMIVGADATGWYWTAEDGIVSIGEIDAVSVSDDGSMILGTMMDPLLEKQIAGIWTEENGWMPLGGLEGETGCDANLSNPYSISGDGSVAVGLGWEGCSGRAFRWTEGTGMLALPQIGPNSARCNIVSGDSLTIGGWDEHSTGPRRAAVWFDDGTEELILEGLPGNDLGMGEVYGMNQDASIMVGSYAGQTPETDGGFIRWADSSIEFVPHLEGSDPFAVTTSLLDLSEDGSIVVGSNMTGFGPFAAIDAILWDAEGGTQRLADVLTSLGAEIPVGFVPAAALAVSDDGRTIVGWGYEGFIFNRHAFVATLPEAGEPCDGDLDGSGTVDGADLGLLLGNWGNAGDGDLDGSGTVDGADLGLLLGAWGDC